MDQNRLEQIVRQQMPGYEVIPHAETSDWSRAPQTDAQSRSLDALQHNYATTGADADAKTNAAPDIEDLAREFLGSDAEVSAQSYERSSLSGADAQSANNGPDSPGSVGTVLVNLPEGAPGHKAVIVSGAEGRIIGMQG